VVAAAQARRKGLLRRAGGMRYSPLQCCHADAPLGRTQRGDGGQSPPLPGRVCRLAFGVRELPLSGAVAVCGPSRSGPCSRSPHVRRRRRAARGRRTYARTGVKIQTWFLNSVLVAESRRTVVCRSRPHRAWRGPSSRRSAPLPRLPRTPRAFHCVRIGAGVWYSPQRKCDVDEVFPRSPPRFPIEDQIRPARRDLCRWRMWLAPRRPAYSCRQKRTGRPETGGTRHTETCWWGRTFHTCDRRVKLVFMAG
jgi:hypothetical protein